MNGFQITSNPPSVISHQRDLRCLLLSLVTLLLSKKCSRELLNNLLLCSEERLSSIGILVKVWTKWNSLKLNPTWTILYPNINNIKMLLPKKKVNSMKKKKMKKECDQLDKLILYFLFSCNNKHFTIYLFFIILYFFHFTIYLFFIILYFFNFFKISKN